MSYTCFTRGKKGNVATYIPSSTWVWQARQLFSSCFPFTRYKVAQAPQKPFRQPQPRTS